MATGNLTDAEIISSLSGKGDPDEAIRHLYRQHFQHLARWVVRNNGSWDDAADTFQEVIISFVNIARAGRFRGESSIATFLYALNRNIWLNELKKRGRTSAREEQFGHSHMNHDQGILAAMEQRAMKGELIHCLEQLDENCRKVLVLYYYGNLSMKDILETMNYENEQVVRNKKYKCLKKLEALVVNNQGLYSQLKNMMHE